MSVTDPVTRAAKKLHFGSIEEMQLSIESIKTKLDGDGFRLDEDGEEKCVFIHKPKQLWAEETKVTLLLNRQTQVMEIVIVSGFDRVWQLLTEIEVLCKALAEPT